MHQSLANIGFTFVLVCAHAFGQEPSAQECLDRTILALTASRTKCIIYSEIVCTSSKPGHVDTSWKEFVKISGEYKGSPLQFISLKESGTDVDGTELVLETMVVKEEGVTKVGQFVFGGHESQLGLLPDEEEGEDWALTDQRKRVEFLATDARLALMLPLFYQQAEKVSISLINSAYNGVLIDERVRHVRASANATAKLASAEKEIVGVWQFGASKVEISFSKSTSWLPTSLRWFRSSANEDLKRSRDGEIAEKPTYENDVIWRKVEGTWIPVRLRCAMTAMALGNPQRGKGTSLETVQYSMYRFKAAEGIGPVNGYFEELRS
jgi:hypothetical protein